jgi:hypothetical protein
MQLTITFSLDNAAFRDEDTEERNGFEIADILDKLAAPYREGASPVPGASETIRDTNGNPVGSITITED